MVGFQSSPDMANVSSSFRSPALQAIVTLIHAHDRLKLYLETLDGIRAVTLSRALVSCSFIFSNTSWPLNGPRT